MEGSSDSEYYPSGSDNDDVEVKTRIKRTVKKKREFVKDFSDEEWKTDDSDWEYSDEEKSVSRKRRKSDREMDDGNVDDYLRRLKAWERSNDREEIESQVKNVDNGFKMPLVIWNKLYK